VEKTGRKSIRKKIEKERRQKAGKKAARKGGGGEWAVIRALTEWVTGKRAPEIFGRSSTSGGKATRSGIARHTMLGDLVSVDPRGNFLIERAVVEVKNRKNANVLDLLHPQDCYFTSKKGRRKLRQSLYCWWIDLVPKAEAAGKIPILVFKRFLSSHWYVVMNTDDMHKLHAPQFLRSDTPVLYTGGAMRCCVMRLDHFTSRFSPVVFENMFHVGTTPIPLKRKRVRSGHA